ncbi:sigma-70 family RNA polymerase sigma factor [Sinomonas sp. ASV322]|uniref:sigma-70 family RNA polymerase sigma factor n=1 Tax=Sinomonas sp. ASV322 TaxID=3041920 RepID=UPI0027DAC5EE|nr:sigma-70 family RNA polymerase sigma factor [Sinomonas sp. ASV322]MDQ4503964.1 sigma-70 family RNA polymerase sigma factor [Sinomonas sp. ASV322]
MDVENLLATRFESERGRLRAVAYRMLGSLPEADDAVQEAWLRLARTEAAAIENLGAWLTTVVGRICLNVLRARSTRREEPLDGLDGLDGVVATTADGPEEEAVMADSVGLALLVVLDTLQPAERLSFVLHDMFDVPFDRIAPILGKSSEATRQLASRARRRVRGSEAPDPDRPRQRRAVEAYLTAVRTGDFEALVALLAPDVLIDADAASTPSRVRVSFRGAEQVAHAAVASAARAPFARVAVVNGAVAIVVAPKGRLRIVLEFGIDGDRITHIDVMADPARLRALEVSPLE